MKYIKLFEEYTPSHFSYGDEFKKTSAEEMRRIAGGNLPKELENITKKFSGKSLNFGITEGKFKVYKWESIFEPILVGEYEDSKAAEQAVRDNDK